MPVHLVWNVVEVVLILHVELEQLGERSHHWSNPAIANHPAVQGGDGSNATTAKREHLRRVVRFVQQGWCLAYAAQKAGAAALQLRFCELEGTDKRGGCQRAVERRCLEHAFPSHDRDTRDRRLGDVTVAVDLDTERTTSILSLHRGEGVEHVIV
eukprot:CAMPEP_0119420072 /NCGR_PEP_ID=MMETSP1335-20130426/22550_1 /TAXON_ID=259385 /ORGANISM="Chrysoculter rhomboideus, Strain RCC1486" /LENGTH=154 /DNA_ID=CAMNT_0007445409 /DNA_START=98 /DNA_END=562 /DNA_ORIENTATION=+